MVIRRRGIAGGKLCSHAIPGAQAFVQSCKTARALSGQKEVTRKKTYFERTSSLLDRAVKRNRSAE